LPTKRRGESSNSNSRFSHSRGNSNSESDSPSEEDQGDQEDPSSLASRDLSNTDQQDPTLIPDLLEQLRIMQDEILRLTKERNRDGDPTQQAGSSHPYPTATIRANHPSCPPHLQGRFEERTKAQEGCTFPVPAPRIPIPTTAI
jgi:hypothetical protein